MILDLTLANRLSLIALRPTTTTLSKARRIPLPMILMTRRMDVEQLPHVEQKRMSLCQWQFLPALVCKSLPLPLTLLQVPTMMKLLLIFWLRREMIRGKVVFQTPGTSVLDRSVEEDRTLDHHPALDCDAGIRGSAEPLVSQRAY